MTKARIVKMQRPYAVVIDDKIVAFARSAYQAAEMAQYYGADGMEIEEWTHGQLLPRSTPPSAVGSSTKRLKTKA